MNYALLMGYGLTVLALIATPGPVVVLVTDAATRHGYRCALYTMAGSNLASLLLIAVAAAMLRGVVAIHPDMLTLLAAAGSCYIAWLAVGMLRGSLSASAASARRGGWLIGFVTGVSNPKDILFFVAFFPLFIPVTADPGLSLVLLTVIWLVIDLSVLSLYIFTIRRWLSVAHRDRVTTISAGFLLLFALYGLGYNGWVWLSR
ncbi:LysE family translocator [Klebsiella sp. B345]|uniref:LysE family translocator n=1 Tax=Klebsiella sp. B345 TaxID=2755398 RepID=UPI003DA99E51